MNKRLFGRVAAVLSAATLTLGIVTTITPVHAQVNGRITATFSAGEIGIPYTRNQLAGLILQARGYLNQTEVSANGRDILPTQYWTTQPVRTTFETAINAAAGILAAFDEATPTHSFEPGSIFDITIAIEGNTGFEAMFMRLNVPQGLELIGFELYDLDELAAGFIPVYPYPTPQNPRHGGYPVFAGWAGGGSNITTEDTNLFTFTLRVLDTDAFVGEILPIALAFAGRHYYETPTDWLQNPLSILLPGYVYGYGESAVIGRIIVE